MRIKRPNGLVYFLIYIFIYPVLKTFFRLKVDRSDYHPPKGAFIAICNHQSFLDFLLSMLTIYPRRLNPVTAKKFFLYRPLNRLLPFMGCIPKNLFDPDPVPAALNLSPEALTLLSRIPTDEPATVDELSLAAAEIALSDLPLLLLDLEFAGKVRSLPGNRYIKL